MLAGFGNRDPAVCICDPFWLWTTFDLDVREEARLLGLVNDIVEAHKQIVGSSETIATCILKRCSFLQKASYEGEMVMSHELFVALYDVCGALS